MAPVWPGRRCPWPSSGRSASPGTRWRARARVLPAARHGRRTPLPCRRPLVPPLTDCSYHQLEPGSAPMQEGPYFDELAVGQEFGRAPGLTLTSGLAAAHQAITGNRLALATHHELWRGDTRGAPPAAPGLVWDVAIGQSTVVTQRVKANLFYRGLAFRRAPRLGDTLRTSTRVVALRQNQPRTGRAPTGLAVLRITTVDQQQRPVLDFWLCAMLPLRDRDRQTGHADALASAGPEADARELTGLVSGWRLGRVSHLAPRPPPAR